MRIQACLILVLFFEEIFLMILQNPTWLPQRANSRLDELCSDSCGMYHVLIKAQMQRAFSLTLTFNLIKKNQGFIGISSPALVDLLYFLSW